MAARCSPLGAARCGAVWRGVALAWLADERREVFEVHAAHGHAADAQQLAARCHLRSKQLCVVAPRVEKNASQPPAPPPPTAPPRPKGTTSKQVPKVVRCGA